MLALVVDDGQPRVVSSAAKVATATGAAVCVVVASAGDDAEEEEDGGNGHAGECGPAESKGVSAKAGIEAIAVEPVAHFDERDTVL